MWPSFRLINKLFSAVKPREFFTYVNLRRNYTKCGRGMKASKGKSLGLTASSRHVHERRVRTKRMHPRWTL